MSKGGKKFDNQRARGFIASISECSIESEGDTITERCKFNFSYFDVQDAGQAFADWDHPALATLLDKLKEFSQKSLAYWRTQGGGAVRCIWKISLKVRFQASEACTASGTVGSL